MNKKEYFPEKSLPFTLHITDGYDLKDVDTLIIFLHGNGEKGTELQKHLRIGLPKECEINNLKLNDLPVAVVSPQTTGNGWSAARVNAVKKEALKLLPNIKYTHITGLSLGGIGTGNCLKDDPANYNSFAICCGFPGKYETLEDVTPILEKDIILWHGTNDTTVQFKKCKSRVDNINSIIGDEHLKLEILENKAHSIWGHVYSGGENSNYWKWLSSLNSDIDEDTEEEIDDDSLSEFDKGYNQGIKDALNTINKLIK